MTDENGGGEMKDLLDCDEVVGLTCIHTSCVKKYGGGSLSVPSTREAHEVKEYLHELDNRISRLEGGIVASADALADLEYRHMKRIEALETNEDADQHASLAAQALIHDRLSALEAHDKCQNCAVSPYIEAEKQTCAECAKFEECSDAPACPNFEATS